MQNTVKMQMPPDGTRPEPTAQVLLNRYRVLETNDQGGFGTVNICWDTRLQRRVAIKRMPLQMEESTNEPASTIDEALAEARTSSMLSHPNIVTMYDFEVDARYSYLVMEYVDGLNLAELLSRVEDGVLSFDECSHVVDSIASALAYAHENGVLHLDIKPANIMIDRSGTVKLGDFGMATLASAAGYGGARGGTIGYMPPEQIQGDYVDERTDIFSLAVVVWQSITGNSPYAAQTPEQSLALIQKGPSPTLSRVEPDLAGVVEETLLRALDPVPSARMSTVEQFARDLIRPLGNPDEGAASLRDLLNQTEEDAEPSPHEDWERLRVPLLIRFPWLPSACTRILAAGTAGWVAYQTIPHILPGSSRPLMFGTLGVAAASAAWPPLGGALGIIACVASLLTQQARTAVPLALAMGIAGLVWWIAVGRRDHLAGSALLMPTALSSPFAGVGLSGLSASPVAAFFTGACGWGLFQVMFKAAGVAFDPILLVEELSALATSLFAWGTLLTCGIASCVCSAISRRGSTWRCFLGQALAVAILIAYQVTYGYVKNGDITATLDAPALMIAVILGATLCCATAIMGAENNTMEGDDLP